MAGIGVTATGYAVRLAASRAEVEAAFSLRYQVFVEELGGSGPTVDHARRTESDPFDAACDQLLLWHDDVVVGTYRLLDEVGAARMGRFYTEGEFDLSAVRAAGKRLLEVGRSCLHKDHRGGVAMLHLWAGVVAEIRRRGAELVFGAGSLPSVDPKVAGPLVLMLEARYGASPELCPKVRPEGAMDLSGLAIPDDVVKAMQQVPPLLKSYLRAGARVGQGAYVDRDLGLSDVCIVLEAATAVWPTDPGLRG
jgi:L-ornithine Nalpha-acyltransferase